MRRRSRWMPKDEDVPMTRVQAVASGMLLAAIVPVYGGLAGIGAPWPRVRAA